MMISLVKKSTNIFNATSAPPDAFPLTPARWSDSSPKQGAGTTQPQHASGGKPR